ncbi:ankyrin repeat domain-containing protein 50-like isoform X2 [Anneissia japonica]|uniref:ankyrin repeat domain-containing protein 50-like isoform X2 n=1 Tax=Anneissia japonica TaxID=1529436 RepID=UPI0014259B1C|nr:ankyrin repeat domain-containing protein 50-like isoform X2 [Anneissia japonica]
MVELVQNLIERGANINGRSKDGFSPLCNAAFWGYSDIVECLLLNGANVNQCNGGTRWTACHCAAFQDHGRVIMKLMPFQPDLTLKDSKGRTAVDFASALDTIWPFFANEGCKRTQKQQLIEMDIIRKVKQSDPTIPTSDYTHFSRPGSAYVMKGQSLRGDSNWSEDRNRVSIPCETAATSLPN